MPREKNADKKKRASEIEERMLQHYGKDEKGSLDFKNPYQLVCAVLLSAQTTDASVNLVTPTLFKKYPTPADLAQAHPQDVEVIIHRLGFYHAKAKHLIEMAQGLLSQFGGEVPNDIDKLQQLPGVGRKTANCVMASAFHNAQGIAVDTHVFRIVHRLRLAGPSANTPAKTEAQILKVFPRDTWNEVNHHLVQFGRDYCSARAPKCSDCFISDLCPWTGTTTTQKK